MTMNLRAILRISILLTCIPSCSVHSEDQESISEFPSVGERRLDIIGERIEAIGCVLDKQAILDIKDGETLVLKHKDDPRGDATVVFNHVILPKGQWVLHGAKNSLNGDACEDPPELLPNRMEAVSATLSGRGINATPRESAFDDAETYRMVYVMVGRISGWDIKLAHSLGKRSATHGLGYMVPRDSLVQQRRFGGDQIPIVNILHRNEKGALLAGALYWFQQPGAPGGGGQPATNPVLE